MLTLFYVPQTRATRPRWLLEEMGLPYTLVRVDPKNKPADLIALQPLGHVPVLKEDGFAVFESAAICLHLAEKDERFTPPRGGAARAHYYQWIVFAMTELEPRLVTLEAEHRLPEAQRDAAKGNLAKASLDAALKGLSSALGAQDYLLGRFTTADVMVGSSLAWARLMGLLEGQPVLLAYVERLLARPAAQRARAD